MTRFRVVIAILLIGGAYWSALPWIDCLRATPLGSDVSFCTFGSPVFRYPEPGSPPGYLFNVLIALGYLVAAVTTLLRRRPF